MESLSHPTIIATILFVSSLLIGGLIHWTYILKLKKHHSSLWVKAGSPTIRSDRDLFTTWPTIKFLLTKQYLLSGNLNGKAFCAAFRIPVVIGYFATCVSVPIFFLCIIFLGWPQS
jgi:hypothetical protein